jgi:protein-disulfide isomerase
MSSRKEQKEAARQERMKAEQEAAAKAARNKRMRMLGSVLGVAAVLVAIGVVVSLGGTGGGGTDGADEVEARFKGIPQKGMELGKPDAPVTMVEFADPQCPFCAEYTTEVAPTLIDKYVKTGKVRMVLRLQTFLDDSTGDGDSSATASMAVALGEQNVAWNFMDLFYINQEPESADSASDDYLLNLANAIPGADGKKALAERDSEAVQEELLASAREFEEKTAGGTPSFLIGPTDGTQESFAYTELDPAEFEEALDEAIAAAGQ